MQTITKGETPRGERPIPLPKQYENMVNRLSNCGSIGIQIGFIIVEISDERVLFPTLNKAEAISNLYASVLVIQSMVELLQQQRELKQVKEQKHTIQQIKVQLSALKLFLRNISLEVFMNTAVQRRVVNLYRFTSLMMRDRALKSKQILQPLINPRQASSK